MTTKSDTPRTDAALRKPMLNGVRLRVLSEVSHRLERSNARLRSALEKLVDEADFQGVNFEDVIAARKELEVKV